MRSRRPWKIPLSRRIPGSFPQQTGRLGAEAGFRSSPRIGDSKQELLFVCCIQAYDPRCMVIPVNVARLFQAGGMEFGILGEEEACCGNEIRRIGESGLFEELQ